MINAKFPLSMKINHLNIQQRGNDFVPFHMKKTNILLIER